MNGKKSLPKNTKVQPDEPTPQPSYEQVFRYPYVSQKKTKTEQAFRRFSVKESRQYVPKIV